MLGTCRVSWRELETHSFKAIFRASKTSSINMYQIDFSFSSPPKKQCFFQKAVLFSTFDPFFFSELVLLRCLNFNHKNEEMVGSDKFSITSPPFFSLPFDGKYTPLAFSKDIPGLAIMNSGLHSSGLFLTVCSSLGT